jgi:hypothetical protein
MALSSTINQKKTPPYRYFRKAFYWLIRAGNTQMERPISQGLLH